MNQYFYPNLVCFWNRVNYEIYITYQTRPTLVTYKHFNGALLSKHVERTYNPRKILLTSILLHISRLNDLVPSPHPFVLYVDLFLHLLFDILLPLRNHCKVGSYYCGYYNMHYYIIIS